jgi:hypothetical protein
VERPTASHWKGKTVGSSAINGSPHTQPMDAVYQEIRKVARTIVGRYPQPNFYSAHPLIIKNSQDLLKSDPSIGKLRKEMAGCLDDNAGHGMGHAEKVAIDAGALVMIEGRLAGLSEEQTHRNLFLAHCSGLLHDICRKEKFHAKKGAETAKRILQRYPLRPKEIEAVSTAIRNHEAFARQKKMPDPQTRTLSDCLYDADKFRWGPDNFAHTVWDMVEILSPPLNVFIARYPKGMNLLRKIRYTFRSQTGKKFGPQFIDLGICIGEELYEVIRSEFLGSS